ncbi:Sphingolipid long chain base-responsive protein LSP1 [Ceratobasidium theobromae]|uniref:Sphingolipid long chain base-responsive protein LSP1 n=1 Tax=Ceratobasidium theobromae TaxID=1582974 RepID=A0A5N5QH60_9AGAM|nr:Sphingolipid long chain base-responsive protein LSP1 [Ceratobasidium theobromae]
MPRSSSRNRSSTPSRALTLSPPDAHVRALQEIGKIEMRASAIVQKLADELSGFDTALKSWAKVQGEDLEDVLSHSANLFAQLSAALVRFVSEGGQVQERFETVREREQRLSALRKRRTCVGGKVDAAQKKVNKLQTNLKPKNNAHYSDHLENLKKQAERIDVDIQIEEAAFENYKRETARECMDRKFAEVVELSDKMRVIGEAGRRIVREIPLGATPPGGPRAPYTGRERTAALYSQAIIDIHQIQIPNDAYYGPYQPQLDDQPDDDDSGSSDEWASPVPTFTRPSRLEESLLSAGQQMGEIYPSVISRSTHALDTSSTSGLSSQFRTTDQITSDASSSAFSIASIASPSSIRSTTNGNIRSRPTVLRQRRHHSGSIVGTQFQPFGLSRPSSLTFSHGPLYSLAEEPTNWTVGSAMGTTSTRE